MKRIFDFLFSLVVLIFISPLLLLIAISIKLTSKGPIFYISKRMGQHFKPFNFIKFRTMYVDADELLPKILEKDPALRKEWETYLKIKKDPRITPIGHFLRKTSLDELPQFLHVLTGKLSVVGPRPLALLGPQERYCEEIREYLGEKTDRILSIKPGITGLWQVSGRNETTFDERLVIEETYLEKKSFFLDLSIILKTLPQVIFPKGAY